MPRGGGMSVLWSNQRDLQVWLFRYRSAYGLGRKRVRLWTRGGGGAAQGPPGAGGGAAHLVARPTPAPPTVCPAHLLSLALPLLDSPCPSVCFRSLSLAFACFRVLSLAFACFRSLSLAFACFCLLWSPLYLISLLVEWNSVTALFRSARSSSVQQMWTPMKNLGENLSR